MFPITIAVIMIGGGAGILQVSAVFVRDILRGYGPVDMTDFSALLIWISVALYGLFLIVGGFYIIVA